MHYIRASIKFLSSLTKAFNFIKFRQQIKNYVLVDFNFYAYNTIYGAPHLVAD